MIRPMRVLIMSDMEGVSGIVKLGSGDPACSTGSKYIRDQATRPSRRPKMKTPRSSSAAPLLDATARSP